MESKAQARVELVSPPEAVQQQASPTPEEEPSPLPSFG
jgi:hypothetical protein